MVLAIVIISDILFQSCNQYKILITEMDYEEILRHWSIYIPNPIIYFYFPISNPSRDFEEDFKEEFPERWYKIPLQELIIVIIDFIAPLLSNTKKSNIASSLIVD